MILRHWHTAVPNLFGILVLLLGFGSLDGSRNAAHEGWLGGFGLGVGMGMVGVSGQKEFITGFKNPPAMLFFFDDSPVSGQDVLRL
jgi:hypothetical protein